MQPVNQKNTTVPNTLAAFGVFFLPTLFSQAEGAGGERSCRAGKQRAATCPSEKWSQHSPALKDLKILGKQVVLCKKNPKKRGSNS